jgi:hypothetical protein
LDCPTHNCATPVRRESCPPAFYFPGGGGRYWGSLANRLELGLVACALLSFTISRAQFLISLTSVRIYRVLRHFPTLRVLIHGCVSSLPGIVTLSVVMMMAGLAFAIMGRYLIGSRMDGLSRSNFGSFSDSLLTILKLFYADGWTNVLYGAMSTRTSRVGQAATSFRLCRIFSPVLLLTDQPCDSKPGICLAGVGVRF